jgi:hypothetical protein
MKLQILILAGLTITLVACSKKPVDETTVVDEPQAQEEEAATVLLPRTASADGASVFFISPTNGETVSSPVTIEFGISGMDVVKAGDNQANSGHHHLLIDTDLPDPNLPIPADANHVHFGDGSTSVEITLEAGEHHLQMLLGDYMHIPHDPPLVSESILITVE